MSDIQLEKLFSSVTPVEAYESDTEVIADLAGFQVTKAELFSHTREPAITIWETTPMTEATELSFLPTSETMYFGRTERMNSPVVSPPM